VAENLGPATNPDVWPAADVVLAVNYFGFPQDMKPFRRYAERTGACVIEDNAHGFLSRDETGAWLGLRGDMGIFSLRKTFLLGTGAALTVQNMSRAVCLADQLPADGPEASSGVCWRRLLRRVTRSRMPERLLAEVARMGRRVATGYDIPPAAADAERTIPAPPSPARDLVDRLQVCDGTAETRRRRELYAAAAGDLSSVDCAPLFPCLLEGTVPYGMPVYCDDAKVLVAVARRYACDVFPWPDLPAAVASDAPPHYRRLHVVNFL
jgi:hypothetical protein